MSEQDPIARFIAHYDEHRRDRRVVEPSAVSLATVDASGAPDCRIVLLKHVDARGFVFYTNKQSQKGRQLSHTPKAALCFFFFMQVRQVRVRGDVEDVTDAEADAYWQSRARDSQIGAWASLQSQPLDDRQALLERFASFEKKFEGGPVPRPPHWSGYRLVPAQIEFWTGDVARLHHRERFTRTGEGWDRVKLFP